VKFRDASAREWGSIRAYGQRILENLEVRFLFAKGNECFGQGLLPGSDCSLFMKTVVKASMIVVFVGSLIWVAFAVASTASYPKDAETKALLDSAQIDLELIRLRNPQLYQWVFNGSGKDDGSTINERLASSGATDLKPGDVNGKKLMMDAWGKPLIMMKAIELPGDLLKEMSPPAGVQILMWSTGENGVNEMGRGDDIYTPARTDVVANALLIESKKKQK
jgi:hypothetical protein